MASRARSRCSWTPRRPELLLALWVGSAALAVAQPQPPPEATAPAQETLYLEVTLNQTRQPGLFQFQFQRDGEQLRASAATLRQLGLRVDGSDASAAIALGDLDGVRFRYDASLQQVTIDAPVALLDVATTRIDARGGVPSLPATSSPGALLDYDLYASRQGGASNLTANGELRVFGLGQGLLRQSFVGRVYREPQQDWRAQTIRLDTQWQWSLPERMTSVVLGDTFSSSTSWSRTVRLGGVRVGSDFGLQPYRAITPLPEFLGEVAVPSSVDLYVNGIRQYGAQLPAGPFQLSAAPGVDGAGNAQVVITDAYGRTRSLAFPFYATQDLLASGLTDWSLALGRVREAYGVADFAYAGDTVGSASWRRGLGPRFTAEAHAEAGAGVRNAGVGGLWLLPRTGVFGASLAHGGAAGQQGLQYALSYRWNNGRFNLAMDTQRAQAGYRDVAARYGAAPPRISERALFGSTWNGVGNIALSYVRLAYPDSGDQRYASLFWTRALPRQSSLNLSINQNLDQARDRSVYLGWSIALDGRRQAGVAVQRIGERTSATADLSQAAAADGGSGWRLQARGGQDGGGGLAEASWRGDSARYAGGIASAGGQRYAYAEASGGVAWIGGGWFPGRDLDQAFALVSTGGVADVPVLLENRPIGRTDARGFLLVTPLLAWQHNRLSIDPMRLAPELRPEQVDQIVVPRDRTGVVVAFPIRRSDGVLVQLHDAADAPLPVGSRVHGPGVDTVVGYDGQAYVEGLAPGRNDLEVDMQGSRCRFRIERPTQAPPTRLGPLRCLSERTP
ncbi:fimbria/pilus outer membrane usher protein [Xanthomonas sacchari]|uniref:fimbria/pilus outer membrane usher protein n=1 Tax=Xanthomonas sacchari TaxID=56458 RepID=UPI00225DEC00|nr:fimbria/pilus outer membrane usher protein [Xanthomonas sacchari]UYK82111.1 fimbria/pilus outer membrane usher protein [Xanthomonas sacchari]